MGRYEDAREFALLYESNAAADYYSEAFGDEARLLARQHEDGLDTLTDEEWLEIWIGECEARVINDRRDSEFAAWAADESKIPF